MFRLDRLTINDFKCLTHIDFKVKQLPVGLVYVTGKNIDHPAMGANDVGKSTLWDALFWCLYGKTPSGLRAGDVEPWNTDEADTQVRAILTINEEKIKVIRSRRTPSTVVINGKTMRQEDANNILRLSPHMFLHTMLFSQFGDQFLDLGPNEKLQLLSQTLNLELWEKASDKASDKALGLGGQITDYEAELDALRGTIKAIVVEIREAKNKLKQGQAELRERGMKLRRHKAEKQLQLVELIKQRDAAKKRLDMARFGTHIKSSEEEKNLTGKIGVLINTHAKWEAEAHLAEREIQKLKQLVEGGSCPTCRQPLSSSGIPHEYERLEAKLSRATKRRARIADKMALCRGRLDTLVRDREYKNKSRAIRLDRYESRHSNLHHKVIECEVRLREILSKEATMLDTLKHIKTTIVGMISRFKAARATRARLRTKRDKLLRKHEATQFWTSGFRHIRLMLVDQTLAALEVEMNNNLAAMGMDNWRIGLAVERETKSSTIVKGFTVTVTKDGQEAPLASWGGGARQRIKLAGITGLADLIAKRCGIRPCLEVWDEPTTHLAPEGVDSLLDILRDRAERRKQTIFLVDHRTMNYGYFAATINLVRENGQTTMEIR